MEFCDNGLTDRNSTFPTLFAVAGYSGHLKRCNLLLGQYRSSWYQTWELNKNSWHGPAIWFGLSVQVYSTSSNSAVVSSESKYSGSKPPWEQSGLGAKSQDATARAWWAPPADVNTQAWCAWWAPIWPWIHSCVGRATSCWAPRWV